MESAVEGVLSAFERVNLVALGERHWVREDAQFRLSLIYSPAFAQIVDDIVVEFANPRYQSVLDRFLNGGQVDPAELRKVWQETTQPGAWDSPVYEEFIVGVRSVNAKLPPGRRLRVLAADHPVDWGASAVGHASNLQARDEFAASLIKQEVLDRNRKALVVFGAAHFYRTRPGTIIHLLQDEPRATSFVVVPVGGPDLPAPFRAIEATAATPILFPMDRRFVSLEASDVLEKQTKRIKVVDGKPVFVDGKPVFIPVFEAGVKLGDLADACLYFGSEPPEFVAPPPTLYEGTPYGIEVRRRRTILMTRE